MHLPESRKEVMQFLEKSMNGLLDKFLKPADSNWQPSDFLPDANNPDFFKEIEDIQSLSKEMSDDLWVVLVGDTITEEALPTYESWLMSAVGVEQDGRNSWAEWVRRWTAEENRHGDLLNKYLYLSGRVNMREVEISTQHLISDGFDIQTGIDPFRNFVYTSFQEDATKISHSRVARLAKDSGNKLLAKICGLIAADEARHATAYKEFVRQIFAVDPSEMMMAFEDMMRKKIIMPAAFLRESGEKISTLFAPFSDVAQKLNVYTTQDYINILSSLIKEWDIENLSDLNESAEKARDYIAKLPARLQRISERIKIPETTHPFKWVMAK